MSYIKISITILWWQQFHCKQLQTVIQITEYDKYVNLASLEAKKNCH